MLSTRDQNNHIAIPLDVGKWYFKIALYDLFEEGGLNYGNQMSLVIPVPSGGVCGAHRRRRGACKKGR
ncbi:hypothetical protein FHT78_002732 [Rhizobium sp. BK196]|uniref:hypothetical protein n=1 Tax=Rhizobium sp. BK196 TaxID=2587073 RepID=UPI0016163FC8|nr:hypothetical protein [Rhizobium sp. BK196]MBB3310988.1 hypothetical protein [Rhizobium sp. BK196]